MLSLEAYGVILAGFASRNNYAILGGLRATAQLISYEIALGISILGVIMVYGTMDMSELVRAQGQLLWGWFPLWGIFTQPVAFFIFVIQFSSLSPAKTPAMIARNFSLLADLTLRLANNGSLMRSGRSSTSVTSRR